LIRAFVNDFNKDFTKYDKLLSRYDNYKENLRKLKIENILENNNTIKLSYETVDMCKSSTLSLEDAPNIIILSESSNKSCGVINKINLCLEMDNGNVFVKTIEVFFNNIATYYGKIVNEMVKNGYNLHIKTIGDEKITNLSLAIY
jgi:hypothetical protein